jgi:hypothetical protein
MHTTAEFLAALEPWTRTVLQEIVGKSLRSSQLVERCLMGEGLETETVAQLVEYLNQAIGELQTVREIVEHER